MPHQTVKIARGLSVSFSSEIITQHAYIPKDSNCASCGGGCDTNACDTGRQKPAHSLTVHRITDGVLQCESHEECRSLQALYAVTDDDGRGEYVALRAFKNDEELLTWIATIGRELTEVRTTLESQLKPSLHN